MAEKAKGTGAERRRHPRVPVHGEVMGSIHTVASAPFVDLSETGALLEVTCALKPGSFYRLKFTVPGSGELVLKTRVVRSAGPRCAFRRAGSRPSWRCRVPRTCSTSRPAA